MEDLKHDSPSADPDRTADKRFHVDEPAVSNLPIAPVLAGTPVTAVFQPDQLLAGRFRVIRFVARGGMGEGYEAEDEELNERVAVKTARFQNVQTTHEIERFRREIQLARKVTHPNVCRTFDVFRHGAIPSGEGPSQILIVSMELLQGETLRSEIQLARKVTHPNVCRTFDVFRHGAIPSGEGPSQILIVSMELLQGETLDKRIRAQGRFNTAEAFPLVEQMCAGLAAAHRVGIVHRDFKSSNVMLVLQQGGSALGVPNQSQTFRAVITDFGLAHAEESVGATLTRLGDIVGTPAYMAPEQINGGAITPATDIYSLGIVIYEMLTGSLPFSADTPFATAMKRLTEPAPSPRVHTPDLDQKWEMVVARCLERAPERRYSSTDDIVKALRGEHVATTPLTSPEVLAQRSASSDSKGLPETDGLIGRFERWRIPTAIVTILLALTGLAIFALRHRAS